MIRLKINEIHVKFSDWNAWALWGALVFLKRKMSGVWLKFSGGGRGGNTFKTPSPYEQLLPLPTPYFKMFLERSLNDPPPPPPHFKHLSLLPPTPSTTPSPPLKILIIHLFSLVLVQIWVKSETCKVFTGEKYWFRNWRPPSETFHVWPSFGVSQWFCYGYW